MQMYRWKSHRLRNNPQLKLMRKKIGTSWFLNLAVSNCQMTVESLYIPSSTLEGTSDITCTSAVGACCIPEESKTMQKAMFLVYCIQYIISKTQFQCSSLLCFANKCTQTGVDILLCFWETVLGMGIPVRMNSERTNIVADFILWILQLHIHYITQSRKTEKP